MYILIESDEQFTYKMVCVDINEAAVREDDENTWELIGISKDSIEQTIAIFTNKHDAYKALQELFEVITTGGESWDAVEFKKNIQKPPF